MYLYNDAGATAYTAGYFGPGGGPVFMSDVYCQGIESSILECSYRVTHTIHCGLESDAGVQCLGKGDASLSTLFASCHLDEGCCST